MIGQWLLDSLVWVAELFVPLLPNMEVPAEVLNGQAHVAQLFSIAGQLSYWVPLAEVQPLIAVALASLAVGVVVRVARMVISVMTFGGGMGA